MRHHIDFWVLNLYKIVFTMPILPYNLNLPKSNVKLHVAHLGADGWKSHGGGMVYVHVRNGQILQLGLGN